MGSVSLGAGHGLLIGLCLSPDGLGGGVCKVGNGLHDVKVLRGCRFRAGIGFGINGLRIADELGTYL